MTPQEVLAHNASWAEGRAADDPNYFSDMAKGQKPEYLWIGCSDSRVPASTVTGLGPGEIFVHRNIANVVHAGDLSLLSVLQFSIDVLKVRHVVLCGHTNCGGVHAAVDDTDHGTIDHWLQPIRDAEHEGERELDGLEGHDRHLKLVDLSVKRGVAALARTPTIRGAWKRGQSLSLHGWVYALETGRLKDLEVSREGE